LGGVEKRIGWRFHKEHAQAWVSLEQDVDEELIPPPNVVPGFE
jgi:hypothetical protein